MLFTIPGVNPQTIKGTSTGVFIGVSSSEAGEAWAADPEKLVGYSMTGCCRAMFPNRLSYFFDFKGKSYRFIDLDTVIYVNLCIRLLI